MPALLKERVDLADRLESYYSFECEGGPLKNCVEWETFKRLTIGHFHKNRHDGTDICETCGHDLRHSVHLLIGSAAQMNVAPRDALKKPMGESTVGNSGLNPERPAGAAPNEGER